MIHYITAEGYQKVKDELDHLKTVARKEVIERIATAKELGDLKENAEYAEAKDDQGMIEAKILELEELLKTAKIVDDSSKKGKPSQVTVGSTVVATCNAKECTYMIVGGEEADPNHSKISYESPIGRAFLNHRVGDSVVVSVPKGTFTYTIIDLR